ncbi:YuzB family protein [Paenibacillus sp. GCM10012307]|uniref:YuzB family protein n=1 Tax=Paenibacillus roseus TaxID=2798579 RepID=A0A934J8C0_9BACL|nr:YuzB family protein [Paenibacillus roseus]MBJ6362287.1 YuzB family protein [Paenibacillus roseus]
MLKPMIEFCASNMHHGTYQVMKQLEEQPEFEVAEYGCLGNCGECYLSPYALVEGEIVAVENVEELYDQIMKVLKRQTDDQEALDKLLDDL